MARVIRFHAQGRRSSSSSTNPYVIRLMGRGDSAIIISNCIILGKQYTLKNIGYNRVVLANPENTEEALCIDNEEEAKKIAQAINKLASTLKRWDLDTYIGCCTRSEYRKSLANSIQT